MNSSTWIAIYLPMFVVLFIIIPQQYAVQKSVIRKIKKKKGKIVMTNELIKKCLGKNCKLSTGSYGTTTMGKVISVNENWIEVETKKNIELINAEFIHNIKINKL